ncbi:MAG: lipopolysaccharide assembly protein LapB [Gammaproteobacteria bacterium]|nr:lipopolysaccharide assembly protein LapB [Gammaproteobacteria bacterium]
MNTSDLLWLLLPVAAASGWWMAKQETRRKQEEGAAGLRPDYFRGLNYLINEQPDKAIEVFVRMLEVDSDTVETHLALGSLFRRRGEVDRAIRIHQNLIARPTLSLDQRNQALLELGQDYMRAGLLDRAESLFLELIEVNGQATPALRLLCDIYQQEKEWDKAIDMARKLEGATGKKLNSLIAQYYCEIADQARVQKDNVRAAQMIKRALSADSGCVRATIMQGDMERGGGDCKAALQTYQRVEAQDPEYLSEVIPPMLGCYHALENPTEMMDYLKKLVQKYPRIVPISALVEFLRNQYGEHDAMVFVTDHLQKQPTLTGLVSMIDLQLAGSDGNAQSSLLMIKEGIEKLLKENPLYRCNHCGFSGKSIHWQCPGCKTWGSVKPIQMQALPCMQSKNTQRV